MRNVLITGAAAGIGRALAWRFATLPDHRVIACDIDAAGLESLRSEAVAAGHLIESAILDVTDPQQWATVLADTLPDGELAILINNAGVLSSGPFEETDLERHRRTVDINVSATMIGTWAAFGYLRAHPGAQVVNLCSASAIYGQPELASYSASKFAVRGFTEALNIEWERHDIRVIAMWPLFVETAMTDGMDIGAVHTLGIHLSPQRVADAVIKATTPRRRLVAGVHYPVGLPARVLFALSRFSPMWATRAVNRRIARM